jgi:hypothetical protein
MTQITVVEARSDNICAWCGGYGIDLVHPLNGAFCSGECLDSAMSDAQEAMQDDEPDFSEADFSHAGCANGECGEC